MRCSCLGRLPISPPHGIASSLNIFLLFPPSAFPFRLLSPLPPPFPCQISTRNITRQRAQASESFPLVCCAPRSGASTIPSRQISSFRRCLDVQRPDRGRGGCLPEIVKALSVHPQRLSHLALQATLHSPYWSRQ